MLSVTPIGGIARGAARRDAVNGRDNRARSILRDSAESGRKEFGPFNPVTVWDGVSASSRFPPTSLPLFLSLSSFPFSFSPYSSVHPFSLFPRVSRSPAPVSHGAHACMHACMQAGRHGGRMHACMHLEARMAQLAVQTGVSLLLSPSFSSFLRLAEERRTAAR